MQDNSTINKNIRPLNNNGTGYCEINGKGTNKMHTRFYVNWIMYGHALTFPNINTYYAR